MQFILFIIMTVCLFNVTTQIPLGWFTNDAQRTRESCRELKDFLFSFQWHLSGFARGYSAIIAIPHPASIQS